MLREPAPGPHPPHAIDPMRQPLRKRRATRPSLADRYGDDGRIRTRTNVRGASPGNRSPERGSGGDPRLERTALPGAGRAPVGRGGTLRRDLGTIPRRSCPRGSPDALVLDRGLHRDIDRPGDQEPSRPRSHPGAGPRATRRGSRDGAHIGIAAQRLGPGGHVPPENSAVTLSARDYRTMGALYRLPDGSVLEVQSGL
jgi:hypothetical protein